MHTGGISPVFLLRYDDSALGLAFQAESFPNLDACFTFNYLVRGTVLLVFFNAYDCISEFFLVPLASIPYYQ